MQRSDADNNPSFSVGIWNFGSIPPIFLRRGVKVAGSHPRGHTDKQATHELTVLDCDRKLQELERRQEDSLPEVTNSSTGRAAGTETYSLLTAID